MKITLGDRYTDYMANVYTVTIDFILDSLMEGYVEDTSLQNKFDIGQENGSNENDTSFVKAAES